MTLVYVLLLAVSASCVLAEDGMFTRVSYPNPQKDFSACGRDRKTWLCDPSHILDDDEGIQFYCNVTYS